MQIHVHIDKLILTFVKKRMRVVDVHYYS